jgi:hypothetical protein
MRSEVPFTLPRGLVDAKGRVHREGVMRLATARDEIEPLRDPDVRRNPAYFTVLLLSRVVLKIGKVDDVTPEVIEGMFAVDFDHLQRLYERLNVATESVGSVTCPECSATFEVDLSQVDDVPPARDHAA